MDITSWRLLKDELVGGIGGTLWVLMGTAGIVLLIACANVANLLLVRADGRRQELAIRAALGAGRIRMARDLLLESGLLGVAGGVLGLTLAFGVLRALAADGPEHLPRVHEIGIDPAVLAFTLGISLASGLLFGLIPVWQQMRPHLSGGLRGGGRSLSPSRERHRARSVLIAVQVALCVGPAGWLRGDAADLPSPAPGRSRLFAASGGRDLPRLDSRDASGRSREGHPYGRGHPS
ncbi:MAG TPA: FtsX-like permease family protein [Bryobacteraceae bacterium]|nr:FtsX-like permease family protein [Bryobacteraceae bacterium]